MRATIKVRTRQSISLITRIPPLLRCLECRDVPDRPAHTPRASGGHAGAAGGVPGLTSRRVKRNRRFWGVGLVLVVLALVLVLVLKRGSGTPTAAGQSHGGAGTVTRGHRRMREILALIPIGRVTGRRSPSPSGDVHFPAGTNLGVRLAADPSDALGPTVPALLSGVDLSMVNLESALTDGTCPQRQDKQYVFSAPASAVRRSRAQV